ncbi:3-deoxy-D-manno-octulosonic acid transferase [Comamonas sp. UBA7528]|uniref:3-deoxy-D-manno-octulosonic acid transferase n=1 Tax=Comamonas sp. UBA7528 TaxID=1946391 RepID=UPI0025B9C731|nr:3-deoxy-D-manno-octulosonic acid transferase [Comamonas sp. UBA7528]
MTLVRSLYAALTWAAQPLLRRKLRRRAQQEPGYAEAVPERFGHYQPADLGAEGRGQWLWVHAVSLGETRAAAILLQALRSRHPGLKLLLTHGTATGRAEGKKLLRPGDIQVWQPWDSLGATRRFVRQFQPVAGVLMETEIWPNLLAACREAGVPVALANARLNAKSLAGARRWAALSQPAYRSLAAIWAQTEDDAARLRQLGVQVSGVFGNVKFDTVPDAQQLAQGHVWRAASERPVLLLASSREGEEALWLAAVQRLRAEGQGASMPVQWLIVPRHPQRFDEVQQLIEQAGLTVSHRSRWTGEGSAHAPAAADVWLGDSMGEMPLYYALAHAGLLGGSFERLGGQNLIEAAACGCPMLLGPHTFNFAEAAEQACSAGAALRVDDMEVAVQQATALVQNGTQLAAMQQQALAFAATHRGAAQATAQAVLALAWPHGVPG